MRPKDLQVPFKWNHRQILIHDRIFYIPPYEKEESGFQFPGWNAPEVFGNNNPIVVEYCSGNGAWIAAKALANPHINWVAIEMKFKRVRKIWSKVKNLQLNNLFIICGEAHKTTKNYFKSCDLEKIYINFPDPWPKNRHAKNRLIQDEFVQEMHRCLKSGGTFTFVTDDTDYSEWTIQTMLRQPNFSSIFNDPYYITEMTDYGSSYFDQLWREKGKTIRYHEFKTAIEING